MKVIIIAKREAYTADQVGKSLTIGQLIAYLKNFDENAEIITASDHYSFGHISMGLIGTVK